MPPADETPESVRKHAAAVARARPMRRGSLSERWMTCGKPTCACSRDEAARHGPYLSVTRVVAGRTQSRYVSPDQAVLVRRQIEAGRRFAEEVEALRNACEAWADAEWTAACIEASGLEAENGGARRIWRTTSRKKSTR